MSEPLGYFLTWSTYGTWLPGDGRGRIEHREGWKAPDPVRHVEANKLMREPPCLLNGDQRRAVEKQIAQTCEYRGWQLKAVNCRSNHIHVVVFAPNATGRKVRIDLKAWATLCLKDNFDPLRDNWWAERGYTCHLKTQLGFDSAIMYTVDGQNHDR